MRLLAVFGPLWLASSMGRLVVTAKKPANTTNPDATLQRSYGRPYLELPSYGNTGTLYSNAKDMVVLSQYIYQHAALIKYATKKENETMLDELSPLDGKRTVGEILDVGYDNMDILEKEDSNVRDATKTIKMDLSEDDDVGATRDSLVLAIHADKDDIKKSCVYAITANQEKKRIVVIFRGTSNFGDWMKDFFAFTTKDDNPVKTQIGKRKEKGKLVDSPVKYLNEDIDTIRIHSGFHSAIISKGKMDEILKETNDFLEQPRFKGYRLFVTGHSLGGALATIYGFYAAAQQDEDFTKDGPVTIISISSPRAGDANFQKAFKHLEQEGKLRHARIRNAKDKVPQVPYFNGIFRHVGLEIRLSPVRTKGLPVLDYPLYTKWVQTSGESMWKQMSSLVDAVRLHGCPLVRKRLLYARDAFRGTTLEEEYRRMWGIQNDDNKAG